MGIKHAFTSSKGEQSDASLVGPTEWNNDHVVTDGAITKTMLASDAVPPPGIGFSGSGLDGAQHFDGSTTILGVTPGSDDGIPNTYVFTRDLHLASGTLIDVGVRVRVTNARFHCRGMLTNNGNICNDGRPGVGRLAGGGTGTVVWGAGNGTGGSGSNGVGGGNNGGNSANAITGWSSQAASAAGVAGAGHGQGGGGGSAGADAGGTGGSITPGSVAVGLDIMSLYAGNPFGSAVSGGAYTYGSGGGGGGVDSADAGTGGGGGAGGNWFFVGIDIIAGTGTITCKGGAGAAGTLADATGCGGGGGGGGGILGVAYGTNQGPNTFSVAGGASGAGAGTGVNGGAGSAGTMVLFNFSGDGT